jgi:nucleotide-binding universal stress UspA family protein
VSPFQKILAPYDFSAQSQHSLEVAADLARRYEAPITVVHVCDANWFSVPESYLLYKPTQLPQLLAGIEKKLEPVKHELLAASVMQVKTQVLQGTPYAEIVRLAKSDSYDLIVMGTHGRSGIAHALLGSVAERVVRKAHCPVLTIRHPDQQIEHP